jgi:hypothetical protein
MDQGAYTSFPELAGLPTLVRRQRRLEAQIVTLGPLLEDEKAVRKEIDGLLVAAGFVKGQTVTCLGYDVTHIVRAGQSSISGESLIAHLLAAGVEERVAVAVLIKSTETGDPSTWATVKPSKGAKVRT